MKKIILLVFVTLFCCVGYSQAQTTKKMTRQEKKEAQKAMEQALFEEARQAIENKKREDSPFSNIKKLEENSIDRISSDLKNTGVIKENKEKNNPAHPQLEDSQP